MLRPLCRRHWLRAAAVALLVGAAAPARAERPAPPADAGRDKATELLRQGNELYEQKKYPEALERFLEAYRLYPSHKLQFNIAQVYEALKSPAEAANAYHRFLSGSADKADGYADKARARLHELQVVVGRLEVSVEPAGAVLSVDDQPVAAGLVYVTPGAHQLKASAPGYVPRAELVAVSAGNRVAAALHLDPVPAARPEPAPAPAVTAAAPPPVAEAPANVPARIAFGIAGVLAVGGVVSTALAARDYRALPDQPGPAPAQLSGAERRTLTEARVADALWVGALLAAGTGAYFVFVSPPAAPGAGGEVGVRGHF